MKGEIAVWVSFERKEWGKGRGWGGGDFEGWVLEKRGFVLRWRGCWYRWRGIWNGGEFTVGGCNFLLMEGYGGLVWGWEIRLEWSLDGILWGVYLDESIVGVLVRYWLVLRFVGYLVIVVGFFVGSFFFEED